jgi:hypothetical protein
MIVGNIQLFLSVRKQSLIRGSHFERNRSDIDVIPRGQHWTSSRDHARCKGIYPRFSFEITHRSPKSKARCGRLVTPQGIVSTPNVVFCGTKGAMKAITTEQLEAIGAESCYQTPIIYPSARRGYHRRERRTARDDWVELRQCWPTQRISNF